MDTWLKRAALLFVVVFLGLLCLLMWRLTVFVSRVDRTLAAVNTTVEQVTTAVSKMGREVDALREGLGKLETATSQLLSVAPVDALMAPTNTIIGKLVDGAGTAAEEIEYLLQHIGQSGVQCEYEGRHRPAAWVQVKLAGVYRLFAGSIKTAEDFIERVASKTMDGSTYYVIPEGGERIPLGDWLLAALDEYRAAHRTEKPAENP